MTTEENELEQLMRLAADDATQQSRFYRCLLRSTVYVLGAAENRFGWGEFVADADEPAEVQAWTKEDGSSVIPCFSSMAVLRRAIRGESSYLSMSGRSLLAATRGQSLFLNPGCDYSRELHPMQIDGLLAGSPESGAVERVIAGGTTVHLCDALDCPEDLLTALRDSFALCPNVASAYVANLWDDDAEGSPPSLLLGIQLEDDPEPIIQNAKNIIGQFLTAGDPVDICVVTPDGGTFGRYFFGEAMPFYVRQ